MHLRRRIEDYLKRGTTTPTRFGRDALGDPRLVFDLRKGRQLRPATRARLCAWLDAAEGRPG